MRRSSHLGQPGCLMEDRGTHLGPLQLSPWMPAKGPNALSGARKATPQHRRRGHPRWVGRAAGWTALPWGVSPLGGPHHRRGPSPLDGSSHHLPIRISCHRLAHTVTPAGVVGVAEGPSKAPASPSRGSGAAAGRIARGEGLLGCREQAAESARRGIWDRGWRRREQARSRS
jgi:hypothetical protein